MKDDTHRVAVRLFGGRALIGILLAMVLGLLASASFAQGTATIPSKLLLPFFIYTPANSTTPPGSPEVRAGSGQVKAGDQIVVPVDVLFSETRGVAAITISIVYDPTALSVIDCTVDPDQIFDLSLCNAPQAGTIKLSAVRVENTPQESVGLAQVSFQATGEPNQITPLDVQISTFADDTGSTLPVVDADGAVEVIP